MNGTKICDRCGIDKTLELYHVARNTKDGRTNKCSECRNEESIIKYRTKVGLCKNRYIGQKQRSKKRGHCNPTYSETEFINWTLSQDLFHKLFDNWVKSGYEKDLSPSVDRIDNDKGYSFDNIQLLTWKENNDNFTDYFNSCGGKAVCQYTKDGLFISEYDSITRAALATNSKITSITRVCRGKKKSTNGFKWYYKDEL